MSYVIVAKGTGLIVTDGPNKTRAYKTFGAATGHSYSSLPQSRLDRGPAQHCCP
jgi:hypothetical protein